MTLFGQVLKNKNMYLIQKINSDGTKCEPFTLDISGLALLLGMATPNKCSFLVTKIS